MTMLDPAPPRRPRLQESYRDLYDSAPLGYFVLDAEGEIQQVNQAGARLLNAPADELLDLPFAGFLVASDRQVFADFLQRGLAGPVNPPCEVALPGTGDGLIRVRLESSGRAGELLRMVAMDITQLRAMDEQNALLNHDLERCVAERTAQLETANADMQAFCYMISHELRAPLARIEGFSRQIPKAIEEDGAGRLPHLARRIEVSSLRMREVIDSLLMMTRLSLEKIELELVDLSRLVWEILAAQDRLERPIPSSLIIAPGISVVGDRRLLEICLRNLLENAVKFSSHAASPEVEFGVVLRNGKNAYFVKDNGVGFDKAHSDKLFQPYVRLHRQQEFEGSGIGLSIVRKIIEKHGGRIWSESNPGGGATFLFTLN